MSSSRKPPDAPRGAGAATAGNAGKAPARASRSARTATGNWNPDWEPFASLDPAWTERAVSIAMAPAVSGALDPKTIEFIGIAISASSSQLFAPAVRRHIRRALDLGATKEEITAVLQCASLQSLYSLCLAAPILLEELEARGRNKP
jgi:alkylhydroperoxidase/carboxymuconolactone decarboxylase family protein YurZ